MPDWKKIKAEYIRGGVSYRELAQKYDVSPSTLMRKAAREKWADLRKKSYEKRDAKIAESIGEKAAKGADKIQSVADLLIEKIVQGVNEGTLIKVPNDIRQLTLSMKDLMEIKGYKHEADLREQLARIAKLEKEAKQDEQNKDIRVVIAAEAEEYAK